MTEAQVIAITSRDASIAAIRRFGDRVNAMSLTGAMHTDIIRAGQRLFDDARDCERMRMREQLREAGLL